MARILAFILCISAWSWVTAEAQVIGVRDISDIYTLEHTDFGTSPPHNLNVRQYSSTIKDGGGEFILSSGPCSSDHGVYLNDAHSSPNCYIRQFSGPVHLSWYGVKDSSNPIWSCLNDFSSCAVDYESVIHNAFKAADPHTGLGGDGGVMTDGLSIYVNNITDGQLLIPSGQYLTCNGPPGGMRQQAGGSDIAPYYSLPSSIILDFGGSNNNTIKVSEQAAFFNCVVRPSWYNGNLVSAITSTRNIVDNIEQKMTGTCVTAGSGSPVQGESVDLHDLFVIGCDTGIDVGNAPRGRLKDLNIEANVPIYNHDNGGGMKLQNISIHNFLEQFDDGSGNSIRESDCPIIGLATVSGNVQVTYATTAGVAKTDCNIVAGDTVLLLGLGSSSSFTLNGTAGNTGMGGGGQITGLLNTGCDASKPNCIQSVHVGDVVTDAGSGSGCIQPNTLVKAVGSNYVDLTNTVVSCTDSTFLFTGNSSGFAGLNGRFLVTSAGTASGGRTALLTGSTLVGPKLDVNYVQGANVVTIGGTTSGDTSFDTTNVGVGQYLCASGTLGPFCNPPSGYTFSAVTSATPITDCSTPTLTLSSSASVAGWPANGLMTMTSGSTSEIVQYKISRNSAPNATKIQIVKRAQDNTPCTLFSSESLLPAAPMVVAVLPWANAVALNAKAQSGGAAQVTFANDQTTNGAFVGTIALNSGYHSWTANTNAGYTPDAQLVTVGNGSGTGLTSIVNAWKVQPGMTVVDVTHPGNIPTTTFVTGVSGSNITVSNSVTTFSGDTLTFSGCGYPGGPHDTGTTLAPWQGNCAATAFAFNNATGTVCNWINAHGWRVYLHLKDSQETVCEEPVFDSGAGNNATVDPSAYGILIEGDADKIEIADGKFAAWNGLVNLPTSEGNPLGLVNLNVAQTTTLLANGPGGKIAASNLKGGDVQAGITYLDPSMDSFSVAASRLAGSAYFFANPSALANQFCDRSSHFGSGECGLPLVGPVCANGASGCSSVTGTDDRFDVTVNGSSTTVLIQLAGIYDTAPICSISNSGTASGTVGTPSVIMSIPSPSITVAMITLPNPDVEPYWTQVGFNTSAATAHIYGSCH